MVGLHKLKDIPLIRRFNDPKEKMVSAKYIVSKIRQGKITEKELRQSKYFSDIQERYERFTSSNILSLSYALKKIREIINVMWNLFSMKQVMIILEDK